MAFTFAGQALADWKPTKTVTFVVPAGTGGGADQMARMIQGIIQKHNLMEQPLVVVNEGGGAGAEGFLDMKGSAGDPNKIIITLSNLFTTPLATGIPFNWKDLTPVKMMALDEFVLWVPADAPTNSAKEYLAAVKAAGDGGMKMGGTGSKQEDQIVTIAIEKAAGAKIAYVPYKGGGEVATQLVGKHVNSSVNNPIEAVSQWKAGALKPLCVFDEVRMDYKDKITETMAWSDIPTCKEAGIDFSYLMLRGIFTTPNAPKEAVDYYIGVLDKVRETPEWKEFVAKGAFNPTALTGQEFVDWLNKAEDLHKTLMTDAGLVKK
ncbi:MAG: tripartite tricarboxylate transporter substrate-binding protein [Hyphomicrobiales bacterium]